MESQRWREVRQRDRSGWRDGQRETERKRGRESSRRHRDQAANADGLKWGEWGVGSGTGETFLPALHLPR